MKERFKNFGIMRPTYLGEPPADADKRWDVVKYYKYDGKECNYVIGTFLWNDREPCFEFSSCGTRYLEDREDGLEEWLMAWCQMKEMEFKMKEIEERY